MIDMNKIGQDFMRRRPGEREDFMQPTQQAMGTPAIGDYAGGYTPERDVGQWTPTQPGVSIPTQSPVTPLPPVGGQVTPQPFTFTPVGGGSSLFGTGGGAPDVSTGQPQPFAPVTGQPPGGIQPGIPQTPPPGGFGMPPGGIQPGTPQVPPPGGFGTSLEGIQPATTMQPGAPGYEEHQQQQQQVQEMLRQLNEGTWTPPPPIPGAGTPEAGGYYGAPGGEDFPNPLAWGQAGDIYSQLAGGMPAMTPEYAQQAWLPYKRQAEEGAMQARESAGMTGMRWGTPLAGQMESIWGGAGERFGSEMERMRMGDIQNQRMTMLGAAGGLGGLGGQYAQLPLTVSESMMRQGMTQQQMQQMEYDRQRDEWLRQQPEYSPYLPYMQQGAQVPSGPAQYQPSFGSEMLNIAGAIPGMFGGGSGGAPTQPLGGGAYPQEWGQLR